jgi:ParB-like chromosome segregation protein Spo0J
MPLILCPDLDYYGGMDMKHIGDLTPDPRNARKHGERNIGQIERSLEAYGAARSIVVDETGRILAGNGLVEAAANVGIEAVRTVESNGNEIIAVVRRGLTEEQKLGLAIADNRTAELADWNADVLKELGDEIDLTKFWSADELVGLLSLQPEESSAKEIDSDSFIMQCKCPKCGFEFDPPKREIL